MNSSLIPEKPLSISPSLAATLGLEEACLLSILTEAATYLPTRSHQGRHWWQLDQTLAQKLMPFWTDYDLERVSRNLKDKGVILLDSAPYTQSREICFAFDTNEAAHTRVAPSPAIASANRIAPNWQPDRELLRRIGEHNIPETFAWEQLPEFVTYWRERGEISHAWGARFLKHVLHQWREKETREARQLREQREASETAFLQPDQDIAMHRDWRPSRDALEVLVKHAGISRAFVEDAIPEFVLYWQERGDVGRTWNSKFIQHVKRQWLRYNSALERDTEPRPIPDNWQPSKDVFDVLKLANIDLKFARDQVPEFLLYWRESGQIYSSWNTKFLQHVKYHWAKLHALNTANSSQVQTHAGQQQPSSASHTRARSLADDLTDRSWAS
jgi:hypothetical protein